MQKKSLGMKIFTVFNYTFLTLLAVTCLLPMVNQLAISFSSSSAVAAGKVGLFPVDFTLDSYKYMADKPEFWKSLAVSLERVLLAVPLSMFICVLAAFPLSRLDHEFPARKYYISQQSCKQNEKETLPSQCAYAIMHLRYQRTNH